MMMYGIKENRNSTQNIIKNYPNENCEIDQNAPFLNKKCIFTFNLHYSDKKSDYLYRWTSFLSTLFNF